MRRIGLIGAPSVGKSALAQELALRLDPDKTKVVDGYAEKASKEGDFALGYFANHVGNMAVALKRVSLERRVPKKIENVITCGTMLDTIGYTSLYSYAQASLNEGHKTFVTQRTSAIMGYMGMFMADTWAYDHVFFLGCGTDTDEWTATVTDELFLALKTFDIEWYELRADHTPQRRADAAMKFMGLEKDAPAEGLGS